MKEKSQNTIAIRTRKCIKIALLELMKEKLFNEITIKEIVIQADISRQTFYRHFQSKEEVLEEYLEQLYEEYLKLINELEEKNLYHISLTYFTYWKEKSALLEILKKSKCEQIGFESYYTFMNQALDITKSQLNIHNEVDIQYTKSFLIGGFFSIKNQWMKNDYLNSPEELATLVTNLLCKK